MRIYRLKIRVNGKNQIVGLRGTDMIRLVAACERNGVEYSVLKCLGRL